MNSDGRMKGRDDGDVAALFCSDGYWLSIVLVGQF